jgi:glycosyltransferase involved in cell wall biosynthesis
LAISESTKRDVLSFCKEELIPSPSISVIRLGDAVDTKVVFKDEDIVPPVRDRPFILCVGTIEVRKNHILLYIMYREAATRGITLPDLVIVGGKGWYTGDVLYQFKHDPLLKSKVHIMHGLSDRQVAWLYENCQFTVYPSVYEGWGLPIAESLAHGKACISSNS